MATNLPEPASNIEVSNIEQIHSVSVVHYFLLLTGSGLPGSYDGPASPWAGRASCVMRRVSAASTTPLPVSPHLYLPPKRRWWPLFAWLWAAGICGLALFGSSQQLEGTGSQGKPLAHLFVRSNFVRSNELAPANRPVKPAVARGPSQSTHAPEVGAVQNIAGDDLPVVNIKTVSTTKTRMPVAAPARTKAYTVHVTAKHSKPVRRYAARKSHRQVVANDWHYGGYSWGRYGFNGNNRYGGWFN